MAYSIKSVRTTLLALSVCGLPAAAQTVPVPTSSVAALNVGETFTIESKALGETRRINVYIPSGYDTVQLPVLYMPDGGIEEDFLHVLGLVQISVLNGTMRPFMLVGIENTARRRDLTGPTENAEDRKIAPVVGGSAAFRQFIRTELVPTINARYQTTAERAIVGESLAGLFVVETLLLEPDLFDTYIAFDPSLWWNDAALVKHAAARLKTVGSRALYVASSSEEEIAKLTSQFADLLRTSAPAGLRHHYSPMPEESHGTIYHPAAIHAFRLMLK